MAVPARCATTATGPRCFLRGISTEARWALTGAPEAMTMNELFHIFGRLEESAIHRPLEQDVVDEFVRIHVRRNTDRYVHGIDNVRIEQIPFYVDLSRYERLCMLAHKNLAHWFCCSSRVCAERSFPDHNFKVLQLQRSGRNSRSSSCSHWRSFGKDRCQSSHFGGLSAARTFQQIVGASELVDFFEPKASCAQ